MGGGSDHVVRDQGGSRVSVVLWSGCVFPVVRRFPSIHWADKEAGCLLVCQAEDVEAGLEAQAMGADLVIAQGAEAGGHGALRATLPLVPRGSRRRGPNAGSGSRWYRRRQRGCGRVGPRCCWRCRRHPLLRRRGSASTSRGQATACVSARRRHPAHACVRHRAGSPLATSLYGTCASAIVFLHTGMTVTRRSPRMPPSKSAIAKPPTGDFDTALIWAGEAVDMANCIEPASAIVERIGREAEACLVQAQTMVQETPIAELEIGHKARDSRGTYG